jgi:hypothetical protein
MRGWLPDFPDDNTSGLPGVKVEPQEPTVDILISDSVIINNNPTHIPWPFMIGEADASSETVSTD